MKKRIDAQLEENEVVTIHDLCHIDCIEDYAQYKDVCLHHGVDALAFDWEDLGEDFLTAIGESHCSKDSELFYYISAENSYVEIYSVGVHVFKLNGVDGFFRGYDIGKRCNGHISPMFDTSTCLQIGKALKTLNNDIYLHHIGINDIGFMDYVIQNDQSYDVYEFEQMNSEFWVYPDGFEWFIFDYFEAMPKELAHLFDKDEADYNELTQILAECEKLGWTFEYGLDAEPFNLRPINQ